MAPSYTVEVYIQAQSGSRGIAFWKTLPDGDEHSTTLAKHTIIERLRPLLKQGICRGLNEEFVKKAIVRNQLILILYNQDDEPCAFILARFGEDDSIYLDVICALEGGAVLLTEFLRILGNLDVNYVSLSALANVLSYYPRFGFEHRKDCYATPPDITMPPELLNWIKQTRPSNDELAANSMFQTFIEYLHKMGYTASTAEGCLDPRLSISEFLERGCDGSGFEMRKCLKHVPLRTPAYQTRLHTIRNTRRSPLRKEFKTRFAATIKQKKGKKSRA